MIKLFLARNIIYFCGLNKTLRQPGSFQGFLKTRLLYLFPGRNFQKILLPQPGILKKVRYTCSQTGVFREFSLSWPRSISKFLLFPRKKNCQHWESIHCPSGNQADVLPLHHQYCYMKTFVFDLSGTKLLFVILAVYGVLKSFIISQVCFT